MATNDAPPIRHEFVEANGLRFHVALAGAGAKEKPLVLCLHGFPECWYSWRHQLRGLSKDFLVAAPDLRGYGESSSPTRVADYHVDALAADAAGIIRALGYDKAFVVGHDWGGAVAWHLAATRPEVVEKLAVLNCPHPMLFDRALRSNLRQIRRSLYMFFFQLPVLPEILFAPKRLGRMMRGSAAKKDGITREDVAEFERILGVQKTMRGGLNYYRAAFRTSIRPSRRRALVAVWKRGISVPTMLVWGEKDPFIGRELADGHEEVVRAPFTFLPIANSSHWVQQEAAAEVNDALRRFFG